MQTRGKIFDDIAKVTSGAVSTLSGIKQEVENLVHEKIERILINADMVSRDEFEVIKAMIAKARINQEESEKRIIELEKQIIIKTNTKTNLKKKLRPKTK